MIDIRWPDDDQHARQHIEHGVPLLERAIALCPQHRVALQAGGCVGLYPVILAEQFANVYTWEPWPANYRLLCENTRGPINITRMNFALSDSSALWSMMSHGGNCGSAHLLKQTNGDVKCHRLDGYGFRDVDLLQLDVEGHELNVLLGAEETLDRCKPVVMLEEYGQHALRYGNQPEDARKWLEERGWNEADRSESDVVMVYGE